MATIDDEQQILVEASDAGSGSGSRGWVRILLALVLGLLAGAVIALLLPREDGPRRAADMSMDPVLAESRTPPMSGTTAQNDAEVEGGPGRTIEG